MITFYIDAYGMATLYDVTENELFGPHGLILCLSIKQGQVESLLPNCEKSRNLKKIYGPITQIDIGVFVTIY